MSVRRGQFYRCNVCGIIVEILDEGIGECVCCGRPMVLMNPRESSEGHISHAPTVERVEGGVSVSVEGGKHPMDEKHRIVWMEILADGVQCRRFLVPGEPPRASFETSCPNVTAACYCSRHGLWRSQ